MAGVVRVDPVGELVLALVAAAVHAGHDLPRAPLPRHPAGRVGGLARHEAVVPPDVGGMSRGKRWSPMEAEKRKIVERMMGKV